MLFGLGLYLAGCLVRPLHGINKSAHTDAYALVTGGICCLAFAAVYWLVDILEARRWCSWLAPIGQNALLAYLLLFLLTNLFGVFGRSPYRSQAGWAGAASASLLTALILGLTWLLSRAGIWLRL
jgi:predicted acyltransferase